MGWTEIVFRRSKYHYPDEETAEYAVVRDIRTEDGIVSGVVVNNSGYRLQNVELLIRYGWLWQDEFSPGQNDPGRVVRYVVPEQIQPGAHVSFTYRPESPLPRRSDGRFVTSVVVVGFTKFE